MPPRSAFETCRELQQGTLNITELKQSLDQRIQHFDSKITAFLSHYDYRSSGINLQRSSPLAGLPITVKDQFHIRGLSCSFGVVKRKESISTITAPIVQRLIDQGAQIQGKTNLPPFAMDFQTSNKIRGICRNPWHTDYTTGGSSGGGSAAVACGMSLIDIGADLAGSLRIPASYCGVYSLLPSEGTFSSIGMLTDEKAQLKHFARPGPIARSINDLRFIWQAIDPSAEQDNHNLCKAPTLNLAYYTQADSLPVDQDILQQLAKAIKQWEGQGHNLQYAKPTTFNFKKCWTIFGHIMGHETSALMPTIIRWLSIFTGKAAALRSPNFLSAILTGYRRNAANYQRALSQREQLIQDFAPFFSRFDAWILPVTCNLAYPHITPDSERGPSRNYKRTIAVKTSNGVTQQLNYLDAQTAFTTPISLLGYPVITMPIGLDRNGLPIGVQLIGKPHQENELLAIAEMLSAKIQFPDCPLLAEI